MSEYDDRSKSPMIKFEQMDSEELDRIENLEKVKEIMKNSAFEGFLTGVSEEDKKNISEHLKKQLRNELKNLDTEEIIEAIKKKFPPKNYKGGDRVPKRYVPKQLSKKDRKKQAKELKRSRKNYKKGKYYTRKKMKSFKTKVSPHIVKARKMYKIDKIRPTRKLAKASKCKLRGLKRMFKKGQGAYFSSGSRPNQTGHSWGYARMASAITGGKASAVDFKIIEENCSKNSRAYKLAKKALKKYKKGMRRVKQVKIGGGKWSLKYKRSINCNRPKGFSQKQYCKKKMKTRKKLRLKKKRSRKYK